MKIFVPSLGRVSTKNRDGSEKRFVSIFDHFLSNKKIDLFLLSVKRQIDVYKIQKFNLKNVNKILIKDITESESGSVSNVILIYIYRLLKSLFIKYPKKIDVIYSPSDLFVDVFPALFCKLKNKNAKLIICMFLLVELTTKNNYFNFRKFLFIFAQRFVFYFLKLDYFNAQIFVLNSIEAEKLKLLGFKKQNIKIIKMPIILNKKSYSKNENNALFIGRFHAQKGINDLIEITKKIVSQNNNFILYVIGGGHKPDINAFKKKILKSNLSKNIKYLGFLDGSDKAYYQKKCKFFFMPSYHESFGLTILEALNFNMKVIAYDLEIYHKLFKNFIHKVEIGNIESFSNMYFRLNDLRSFNHSIRLNNFLKNYDINTVSLNEYNQFKK